MGGLSNLQKKRVWIEWEIEHKIKGEKIKTLEFFYIK